MLYSKYTVKPEGDNMEALEIIGYIIPIITLIAGLVSYIINERAKIKEKKVTQLNYFRDKIQNDDSISTIMFLCDTHDLNGDFFSNESVIKDSKMYKDVVSTLGFFDAMCYSFYSKNLAANEFLYFIGEIASLAKNESIKQYLKDLERKNYEAFGSDLNEADSLVVYIYPYYYFQIISKISVKELYNNSQSKIIKMIKEKSAIIDKDLKDQYRNNK